MNDARRVRRGKAPPRLTKPGENRRRLGLLLEPGTEGAARHELHGDEELIGEAADVVHGDDVGVGEPGEHLRLPKESGALFVVGVAAGLHTDELERHLAIELGIVRGVDDALPARAHRLEHDVPAERRATAEHLHGSRRSRFGERLLCGVRRREGGIGHERLERRGTSQHTCQ